MKLLFAILLLAVVGCRTDNPVATQPVPLMIMPQSAVVRFAPPAPPLLAGNVTLVFDAPEDITITGYRIYYSDEAGLTDNVDVGLLTTNSISLEPGASYKIWAVSYNADGFESLPSNEVSYEVLAPIPPDRTVVIILWTGPSVEGPWPAALTTNRIPATNVQAFFNQTLTLE